MNYEKIHFRTYRVYVRVINFRIIIIIIIIITQS